MGLANDRDEKNLFGYLAREFETFDERPIGEVDSLVLSCLSYYRWPGEEVRGPEGLPVRELFRVESFDAMTQGLWDPEGLVHLLASVAASPRFRDVRVCAYADDFDESAEKQFSACTLLLPCGGAYLSFRGTDNTVVGWKEDFNMAFETGVPSQLAAVSYVERVAPLIEGPLYLGGHSKGGNLAVYSAAKSSGEIQERIVAVHNNDGPGFAWDISETPGHKRIASRIHTILPQTSVVGMLMEHEKRYQVVHSTYDGLYQHDGFSWQVLGTQFVHLDDFSREGKLVDETLSSWADSLNTQQREALADALYSVFTASGAKTLSELTEEKLKSAAAMLKTYKNLDRETRRMVTEAFMLFFKLGTKNFVLDTQEEGSREIENIRKKISEQYQKLVERKK